ncbi:hypothetical protein IMAU30056_01800 [Lactobacillus helveticus]|nr:hypothetical protein [Lactobacillus helveticus]
MNAESHLARIEDSVPDRRHRTAQHETIKDIKSILKHARKVGEYDAKIDAKADENEYVYVEDEEGVKKEFKELDEKLDRLSDTDGYDIKRYREEHHSLEKAKEVLAKAGKLE